jgi:hypothetical protein
MKHIRGVVVIAVVMFILFTLLSLLIPSKILSSQGVTVSVDSLRIFNSISNADSIAKWHPVCKNAVYNGKNQISWNVNKQEYAFAIESAYYPVVYLNFLKNKKPVAQNILTVSSTSIPNQKQVQWQTVYNVPWYPWEKFAAIFMEKEISNANRVALEELKKYLEP